MNETYQDLEPHYVPVGDELVAINWLEQQFIEKPKDAVTVSVMEDLKKRADKGLKKYDTTLEQNNHQNMLQHAYEETLDLAQYLKKEITTLNTIQDLVKRFGNDAELGEAIRQIYGQK